MKFNGDPHSFSESERTALQKVLIEGLRAVQGDVLRLPIISGAVIANTMYHVEILHHRALNPSKYNVVFTLRTRSWVLKIPADMDMKYAKADLGFDHAELIQGNYDSLKHDLTLAVMFIE